MIEAVNFLNQNHRTRTELFELRFDVVEHPRRRSDLLRRFGINWPTGVLKMTLDFIKIDRDFVPSAPVNLGKHAIALADAYAGGWKTVSIAAKTTPIVVSMSAAPNHGGANHQRVHTVAVVDHREHV